MSERKGMLWEALMEASVANAKRKKEAGMHWVDEHIYREIRTADMIQTLGDAVEALTEYSRTLGRRDRHNIEVVAHRLRVDVLAVIQAEQGGDR